MKQSHGKKMSVSSKVINPKSLKQREGMKTEQDFSQRSVHDNESSKSRESQFQSDQELSVV